MRAFFAAFLGDIWLKPHKTELTRDIPEICMPRKNLIEYVPSAIRLSPTDQKVKNVKTASAAITSNDE